MDRLTVKQYKSMAKDEGNAFVLATVEGFGRRRTVCGVATAEQCSYLSEVLDWVGSEGEDNRPAWTKPPDVPEQVQKWIKAASRYIPAGWAKDPSNPEQMVSAAIRGAEAGSDKSRQAMQRKIWHLENVLRQIEDYCSTAGGEGAKTADLEDLGNIIRGAGRAIQLEGYKLRKSPNRDWFEVSRVEGDGTETGLTLVYGSNHDEASLLRLILMDSGVPVAEFEYDFD